MSDVHNPVLLERYFTRLQHNYTETDISDLARHGISALECGVEVAAVKPGKMWARQFAGDRFFITRCYSPADGSVCDLIAFRLQTPLQFWRYTGQGAILGYDEAMMADFDRQPLLVHQSPYQWLKSGLAGCCFLDLNHYWAGLFGNVASIRVNDGEFGRRLKSALSQPVRVPPIEVRS